MSRHAIDSEVLTVEGVNVNDVYLDRETNLQVRAAERVGERFLVISVPLEMIGGILDKCGPMRIEYWCHCSRLARLPFLQQSHALGGIHKFRRCQL